MRRGGNSLALGTDRRRAFVPAASHRGRAGHARPHPHTGWICRSGEALGRRNHAHRGRTRAHHGATRERVSGLQSRFQFRCGGPAAHDRLIRQVRRRPVPTGENQSSCRGSVPGQTYRHIVGVRQTCDTSRAPHTSAGALRRKGSTLSHSEAHTVLPQHTRNTQQYSPDTKPWRSLPAAYSWTNSVRSTWA